MGLSVVFRFEVGHIQSTRDYPRGRDIPGADLDLCVAWI